YKPPAAQPIDGRHRFRQDERVVLGNEADPGPKANGASASRRVGERGERITNRDVRRGRKLAARVGVFRGVLVDENHMLRRPERREAEPFGCSSGDPEEVWFGGGADADREEPDFHSPPSLSVPALIFSSCLLPSLFDQLVGRGADAQATA